MHPSSINSSVLMRHDKKNSPESVYDPVLVCNVRYWSKSRCQGWGYYNLPWCQERERDVR
jgi:hypothetical protein